MGVRRWEHNGAFFPSLSGVHHLTHFCYPYGGFVLQELAEIQSNITGTDGAGAVRFFDRNLHSRVTLVSTPARLKRAGV
jgi:hypothetical protein